MSALFMCEQIREDPECYVCLHSSCSVASSEAFPWLGFRDAIMHSDADGQEAELCAKELVCKQLLSRESKKKGFGVDMVKIQKSLVNRERTPNLF